MIEKKPVTVKSRILKLMHNRSKGLTAREIAEKGNLNYNTVRKELGKLLASHLFTSWDAKVKRTRYSAIPF